MKRFYLSSLAILFGLLTGWSNAVKAQNPVSTYVYTGGPQYYTVIPGVFSLTIDMQGAKGGNSAWSHGGYGGRVQCKLNVTPGTVIQLDLGGQGTNSTGTCCSYVAFAGGWNGGGTGYDYGGGGGGATDMRLPPYTATSSVVVAGAGAGAGADCTGSSNEYGGDGGGLTGATGWACGSQQTTICGQGGTQNSGGLGATNYTFSQQGGQLIGASEGSGHTNYSGGGGSGWWGGGSGAYGGGGGGSSFTNSSLVTGTVVHTPGNNSSGNGTLTFTANCTTPVSGTVVGPVTVCGAGGSYLYTTTATSGGVWTSSNTSVATIDPSTGIMTAVSAGPATISYSDVFVCGSAFSTLPITVNPLPNAITGPSPVVCQFLTVGLTNTSPGIGTWSSSNTGLATVNSSTGVVTGVLPGNPIITYTAATGCTTTTTATVNAVPASITGFPQMCRFASTQLSDASASGNWTSANTTVATVSATGLVSAVSVNPAVQTAVINYTFPTTGCKVSQTVSVNPLPAQFAIFTPGSASYCAGSPAVGSPAGSPGVDIKLLSSTSGINYQLYQNGSIFRTTIPGTGAGLDWGNQLAGTYTAVGIDGTTGCTSNMTLNVVAVENPVPTVETVSLSASGNVCAGAPVLPDVIVNPSQNGVTYVIYNTLVYAGGPLPGNGSGLDFGPAPAPGTYTAIATTSVGCTSNMAGSPSIIVTPLPNIFNMTPYSGVGSLCPLGAGPHIGLDFSNPGISYTLWLNGSMPLASLPGSSSAIDFGPQSLGGTYTIIATNTTTGCTNNMNGSVVVTINPAPNVYNLSGSGTYCAGTTGVDEQLNGSDVGVGYQLYVGGSPVGTPTYGTGAPTLDLGFQFLSGTYTAIATNTVTGCTSNMTGSGTISINPLPNATYTVGGGGPFCIGGTGSDVNISGSEVGIYYQMYLGGASFGGPLAGTGSMLDFGPQTSLGNYTVVATNHITGCSSNLTGSVTVSNNPLPNAYPIGGGGNYCIGGTGVHVTLSFSNLGVDYALWLNGTTLVRTLPGSSGALDFGLLTTTGTYTIVGTNTATGCSNNMTGSVTVTSTPPPAVYTVTASGSSYCAGGTGVDISLSSSDLGIGYQLFNAGMPVGGLMAGTGLALDWGMQTAPGNYTIVATNGGTSCTSNMFGSAPIVINPLPAVYTITGGGNYCAGGTGVHIGLSNSDIGIYYWLFIGGTPVSYVAGTGSSIDFGLQTAGGVYQIVAVNYTTTCTNNMGGTVTVNAQPAPNAYPVTGGGTICAGGAGFNIGLGGSDVGITYQLYNGITPVGSPVSGTNIAIDFGVYSTSGTYTVIATNNATTCTANMTGSKSINVNPLPVTYTVYGGGAFCAGTPAVHVFLSGSSFGDNYQLYNGGVPTGGTVTATGGFLDFGAQPVSGLYTVVGTDALTGCSANMISSTSVTANPSPAVYAVTGGGSYCAGGAGANVGLSWSDNGIGYQLYTGGAPVGGAKAGAGIVLDFGPQTGTGAYTVVAKDMVTGCTSNMTGSASVSAMPNVTPTVGITTSTGSGTVCEGTVVTFTADPVNGGSTPAYIWFVNGTGVSSSSTYNYIPANGDLVRVVMTSDAACVTTTTAMNTELMSTVPYELPSATLAINPGASVCKGSSVTYTATAVNDGSAPSYTWIVNSLVVATGTTTYSNVPVDGDVVIFMLGSNYPCRLADTVLSNTYKMAVDPGVPPVVSILARPGTLVQPGQNDTLTASAINVGTAPTYQWSRNGAIIPGATNATYISPYFYNNDSMSCEVTSSLGCGLASFNSVHIQVRNVGVQTLTVNSDVKVIPNPNKGNFTVKGSVGTADEQVSLEVTNMLGQVVYSSKVMVQGGNLNEQIQLGNNLANGMYLLNVRSAGGTAVFHFVVEQ
jgi:glycine rich protein/type IX secretion system substrate protein/Big-like domain-containing protein